MKVTEFKIKLNGLSKVELEELLSDLPDVHPDNTSPNMPKIIIFLIIFIVLLLLILEYPALDQN